MSNTLKVLFWQHRSKFNSQGKVPIQIRLTYHSQRADKSTGFHVNPARWSPKRQRLKGSLEGEQEINAVLDNLCSKSKALFNQAQINGDVYLPDLIAEIFVKQKDDPTLLQSIAEHNANMKARVGKDYSFSTYEKYCFMEDKVKAFVQYCSKKDYRLKDLTVRFIMDFDHYLRTKDSNQHNTAVKYCLNLKRVINVAVLRGLIPSNPFNAYKTVYKDTQQVYLDETELDLLRKARLITPKHIVARDLFLFQANTGLAYTDLSQLKIQDITVTDGQQWIIKPRQKTEIVATIPIMPEAESIIEKHKGQKHRKEFLFPSVSIQKYNQYLSEIADLVGLTKKISSHVGRRTFGNIALAKGISINVISKVLGHSNTIITQRIYAVTTQRIVAKEMEKWS